jgi:hypothetical protein
VAFYHPRLPLLALFVGAGLVTAGAGAAATGAGSSLPTTRPKDAAAANLTVVQKTFTPKPTKTVGLNGFETMTVRAPSGKRVLQGFATIAGGNTGSVLIRSTRASASAFVVSLSFPGEQGTPGKLYVQVQLTPR